MTQKWKNRASKMHSSKLLMIHFGCMEIKDNHAKTSSRRCYRVLRHYVAKIDPNFQMNKLQDFTLSKIQACVNFEEKHCLTTTYKLQIKKMRRRRLQYLFSTGCASPKRSFLSTPLHPSTFTGFCKAAFLKRTNLVWSFL